ncbi:MAG: metallophosphoesterase [Rubrivivax sp.]|nr:metallophosphoesterase [Rubrivivax sp.]
MSYNHPPASPAPAPDTHREATPSRRSFLKFSGAAPLAAAAGTALSACGGGDDTPAADQGPAPLPSATFASQRALLSEPMLQNPGATEVSVVWFSEVEGGRHSVRVGSDLGREFIATSRPMSRMLEDSGSQVFQRITSTLTAPQPRAVVRHEARVTGLVAGQRVPYVAISEFGGQAVRSGQYTLQPLPAAGQRLRILLSSDQQNNAMAAANFQKVVETVGGPLDAVLFPGDFVSQPNRASEWFDRVGGGGNANFQGNPAFFQSLQGTMQRWNPGSPYRGGEVLQHAPLYGCLGNHEYPGRWRLNAQTNNAGNPLAVSINNMDNDPQPRWYAEQRYERLKASVNPGNDPALRARWIADNAYEWTTYREMWSLPEGAEGSCYYAQRFGDVFIISLDANRVWRGWGPTERGKFTERFINADGRVTQNADEWGFGDITFRPFGPGSQQFAWLQQTLQSEACRTAKHRIVLSHQTMAGLGDNAVPVQAEIRATVELTDGSLIGPFAAAEFPQRWPAIQQALDAQRVRFVRYEYPLAGDIWRNHIEPLLQAAGVQLVHTGHSHLWNRARAGSLNYLETANVGNSFGAMFFATPQDGVSASQGPRGTQPGDARWAAQTTAPVAANAGGQARTALSWTAADYPTYSEPHGRTMVQPSIANPMRTLDRRSTAWAEQDLPFVASNNLTSFSILDTGTGTVASYVFDTRVPGSAVLKFDEFSIA